MMAQPNWDIFQGKESENNWSKREDQLQYLIGIFCERDSDISHIILSLRTIYHQVLSVLHTPRTQLALTACKFVKTMAMALSADDFDYFSDVIMSNLVRVCASTKKLVASAGQEALEMAFQKSAPARVINTLNYGMQEKNAGLRQRVIEAWLAVVRQNSERWFPRYWQDVESTIMRTVGDASPVVRGAALEVITIAENYCADPISRMIASLDHSTGKQLKQLLMKKTLKATIATCHDAAQMSIPMKCITHQEEQSSCKSPPSSPKLTLDESKSLALSTPYHQKSPDPLPSGLSIDSLIEQLSEDHVPIAVWKKLSLMADASHPHLTPFKISSLLTRIGQRLSTTPFDDLGTVGMLVKQLLHMTNEYLDVTDTIFVTVFTLEQHFSDLSLIWKTYPISWITFSKDRLELLLNFALSMSLNSRAPVLSALALDGLLKLLKDRVDDNELLSSCLPSLNQIWTCCKDTNVKKSVVACITMIRRYLGDSLFYQILPQLTIPQRRLLDAYMSIGVS